MNMPPKSACDDSFNGVDTYAKHSRKTSSANAMCILVSNCPNLSRSEFGLFVLLAAYLCPMDYAIVAVGRAGTPRQISQCVVGRVPVRKVAAFHAGRAGTDKRLKYQPMDSTLFSIKSYVDVAARIWTSGETPPVAVASATPHAAVRANAVVWKAIDVAVFNSRLELRHADLRERFVGLGATVR